MRGNVGAGVARGVVAQAMGERVDEAEHALGAPGIAKRDRIGREQFE